MQDIRLDQLHEWSIKELKTSAIQLKPLAGDASFRRYFRLHLTERTLIAMDAPPQQENMHPFVAIAQAFAKLDINVPHILACNLEHGFMLLDDLGDHLYLNLLNSQNVDMLYEKAFDALLRIQTCQQNIPEWTLPHFDQRHIQRELDLFPEWFLTKHLKLTIDSELQKILDKTCSTLINSALEQPQVCVHRDYHSRNLLLVEDTHVGVLDFQDAVWGPITYDLVSLLRDCYIDWPREKVEQWALQFHNHALKKNSPQLFLKWFDLMGIQRHLKVLGIFARLCYRDNKPNYLNDIPRILNYVLTVSENYPELAPLRNFLKSTVTL